MAGNSQRKGAMRKGASASEALKSLLAKDDHTNVRQVGMVDAQGRVAVHTGDKAIDAHCEIAGDHFTVQANMMANPSICPAMKSAFEAAKGPLAERMLAALDAGQAAGGDIRSALQRACNGSYWDAEGFEWEAESAAAAADGERTNRRKGTFRNRDCDSRHWDRLRKANGVPWRSWP